MSLGNLMPDPHDPKKTVQCGLSGITPDVKKKFDGHFYGMAGALLLVTLLLGNKKDVTTGVSRAGMSSDKGLKGLTGSAGRTDTTASYPTP